MSLMMPLSAFAASISYANGILSVTGAEGEVLEVVSLTGKRVMEERISSPAQQIELNIPKGCYIVNVGDVVRKVSVRLWIRRRNVLPSRRWYTSIVNNCIG